MGQYSTVSPHGLVVIRSGVLAHAWCDPVVWCRYSGYNLVYLLVLRRSLHRASGSGIYSGCEGSAVTTYAKVPAYM